MPAFAGNHSVGIRFCVWWSVAPPSCPLSIRHPARTHLPRKSGRYVAAGLSCIGLDDPPQLARFIVGYPPSTSEEFRCRNGNTRIVGFGYALCKKLGRIFPLEVRHAVARAR